MAYFRRDLYRSTVVRRILISKSEIAIGALLVGLVCSSILDGVKTDNGAHLGGFVFGFIGAWIFPAGKIRTRLTAALVALSLMGALWYIANQRYYSGEIHEARGTLAVCREDWPVAYSELVQALDYNNKVEGERVAGNVNFDLGQTICSLMGISRKGKVASLYNDASWTASALGKYREALTLASKGLALETGPGQLDTRAVAYLGLQDYPSAEKDLQDALKIAPHYPEVLFHLAQLKLLEKNAVGTGQMSKQHSYQPDEWEYRFGRP
jgi:tetratricopeptide (TPR) repeat protein